MRNSTTPPRSLMGTPGHARRRIPIGRSRLANCALLATFLLFNSACESPERKDERSVALDPSPRDVAPDPAPVMAAETERPKPVRARGTASPDETDGERPGLAEALRGLRYESGLVVIDEDVAHEIVSRPDPAEATRANASGNSLLEQGLTLDAIRTHTRAVLLGPKMAITYEGLGQALYRAGLVRETIAAFRSALQRDPGLIDARFKLGLLLQVQGDLQEASLQLSELVARQPSHGHAHSRLAVLRYYLQDYAGAWKHLHAAEALDFQGPPQLRVLLEKHMPEPR